MQNHKKENKRGHQEIQPRDHRETIMASKSLKKVRRTQQLGQDRLITLLDKQGRKIHDQNKIIERIEEFYTELYDSEQNTTIHTDPKEVPEITSWEVEATLRDMKNVTATGNDNINIETLKAGEDAISKTLAKLYTKCLSERRIPTTRKNAKMMIIFKKGNKKDLNNYKLICILSNIYKVLQKVLPKRLQKTLDENKPREQAEFRSGYSTTDHIHVVNQLKEKCREYNIQLYIAFVNYEKAFDSVQAQAVLISLQEQGIEDVYIELLKEIYTNSSMTVHLHKESNKINIRRGVRQGDTISPKLFTAAFASIFRRLTLETRGLKIDGEYLSHLRFADDIFIYANTPYELQQMLKKLADEIENQGLKMNKSKTKVMMENDTPIYVNNTQIENVESYTYLGQRYSTRHKNQDNEIQRRITAGRTAFAKHSDIFKGNIGTWLKRQVYNLCVLPAMTYGAETWALTTEAKNKLTAAHKNMERSMLNITYRDRQTNIWVREKTKVTDVIELVRRRKWTWAEHVSRIRNNRWTLRITTWKPYERKIPRGRPARRWRDELDDYWKGTIWQRIAQDRQMWKQHAEGFAQPRDTTAAQR